MNKAFPPDYSLIPFLTDSLAAIVSFWVMLPLAQQFATPSGINALLVLAGYILFCSGVFLLRKLGQPAETAAARFTLSRQIYIVLGVLFGISMMLFLAQQLGYLGLIFTDPYSLGEGQAAAFFVFAPSAWLGISLFYIPILAFTVTPNVLPETKRYSYQSLFGLLAVNNMLLLATAQLKALSQGGSAWFLLSFLLLLLWFGPPRWLYKQKRPNALSLVTFALLVIICSWHIIA